MPSSVHEAGNRGLQRLGTPRQGRGYGTWTRPAVNEMLDVAFQRVNHKKSVLSFADLGCGNGWVVRLVGRHENCVQADGFDGAPHMIEKAKNIDSQHGYHLALFPDTQLNNTISFIQWNSSTISMNLKRCYNQFTTIGYLKVVGQ